MLRAVARCPKPLRSVLYVPAINAKAVAKARALDVDAVILDLEDAVAPSSKVAARELLGQHLSGPWGHRAVAVRVNGTGTKWFEDDLRAVGHLDCAAVVLPKVESFAEVLNAGAVLRSAHPAFDAPLWAMVETPLGVLEVGAIAREAAAAAAARSTPEGGALRPGPPVLECLVAGTSDLTAALGARHEPGRQPLLAALSTIVTAARAYGLRALDGVCLQLPVQQGASQDGAAGTSERGAGGAVAAFLAECAQGRSFGFHGKTLIHPSQVEGANAAFGPSPNEIVAAERVIAAFEAALARGDGVVVVDGRLIEVLHIKEARATLEFASLLAERRRY